MIVFITKLYVAAQVALANKKGAAMVEYALLAALIAVVAVGTITNLGTSINGKFQTLVNSI